MMIAWRNGQVFFWSIAFTRSPPHKILPRVTKRREANIYERQRYRHIVGLPAVSEGNGVENSVETPFLVVRIMRDGRMDLFATGRYLDKVVEENKTLKFAQRIVVCDSSRFDTLLAIPL